MYVPGVFLDVDLQKNLGYKMKGTKTARDIR